MAFRRERCALPMEKSTRDTGHLVNLDVVGLSLSHYFFLLFFFPIDAELSTRKLPRYLDIVLLPLRTINRSRSLSSRTAKQRKSSGERSTASSPKRNRSPSPDREKKRKR